MIIKPFADIGNFTPFPNAVLDYVMPACSGNVWKVVCATIRKTTGWNKQKDRISTSQYSALTGIKNRSTLLDAIKDALEAGYLIRTAYRNSFVYSLNPAFSLDVVESEQYEIVTKIGYKTVPISEPEKGKQSETVTDIGYRIVPKSVTESYLQKKKEKINIYIVGTFLKLFTDMAGRDFETEEQAGLVAGWLEKYGETRVLKALEYYIAKGLKMDDTLLSRMGSALPRWNDNTQPAARGVYPGRPSDTRPATIIHLSNGEDE